MVKRKTAAQITVQKLTEEIAGKDALIDELRATNKRHVDAAQGLNSRIAQLEEAEAFMRGQRDAAHGRAEVLAQENARQDGVIATLTPYAPPVTREIPFHVAFGCHPQDGGLVSATDSNGYDPALFTGRRRR